MTLIYGSSDSVRSSEISRAVKAGKLRKLASKLYTDDLRTEAEEIIRRNRLEIAAHFYPDAVMSHRTALEGGRVSPAGKLHLTVPRNAAASRKLPGLEIRVWKGPGRQSEDIRNTVGEGLEIYIASQARAVLENFQIARARRDDESKILSSVELEKWFDDRSRRLGVDWLGDLLESSKSIAARLDWHRELEALEQFAAALSGKSSSHKLVSELANSRAKGKPYDPDRVALFAELHARLSNEQFAELPKPPVEEIENRAFWEAYFSNFIEGTRFSVEEAQELVTDTSASQRLQAQRPEDAHDIRETYRLIVDPNISGDMGKDISSFFDLLKRRHSRMMASRPWVEPGVFKKQNNEVGSRVFVAPDLVEETLARGWSASRDLPSPAARAFYLLFVVSEVHPFKDGNGRISRLGMNAELERANRSRLVIPTSLRNDYFTVLEALTSNGNTEPFVAFAHKLIDINKRIPFGAFEESHNHFKKSRALDEPTPSSLNPETFL